MEPLEIWDDRRGVPVEVYAMDSEMERAIYGFSYDEAPDDFSYYSDESTAKFRAWCEDHGFHFYAACKEDFFVWKGVEEARAAGKTKLIAENLS